MQPLNGKAKTSPTGWKIFMLYRRLNFYEKHGYRFNPFAKFTPEEFTRVFPADEQDLKILRGDYSILQVVGGCGFGKTSFLLKIADYINKNNDTAAYIYTSGRQKDPPGNVNAGWIILDEAQRLKKREFTPLARRWIKKGGGIILGSHMDHEKWFDAGMKIKTVYMSKRFKEKLPGIVEKRLNHAAIEKACHRFTGEAYRVWSRKSGRSLEIARMIGYEIFLNRDLPETIDAPLVEASADRALKNMFTVLPGDPDRPESPLF